MSEADVEDENVELAEPEQVNGNESSITLFGTDEPEEVMEQAKELSVPLADEIEDKELFSMVMGNRHVNIEGWTMLGSMVGVFPETIRTNYVEYGNAEGFEAKVNAVTRKGEIVGSAEAMCTNDEDRWENATLQELRSMAQTRAASKALRMPLGFIVQLAGFNATPAEEMGNVEERNKPKDKSDIDHDPSKKLGFGKNSDKTWDDVESGYLEWLADAGNDERNKRAQLELDRRESGDGEGETGKRSALKTQIQAYAKNLDFSDFDNEWSVYVQKTAEKLSMDPDDHDVPVLESIRDYLKDCVENEDYLRVDDDDTFPVEVTN